MTFETLTPGLLRARARKMDAEEWDALAPGLEARLLALQFRQKESGFPLIVVLSGEDRPGVGALVARLAGWLDPRHVKVYALGPPTEEEREQPPLWRFWRHLPGHGDFAIFVGAWTAQAVVAAPRKQDREAFDRALGHIVETERAWIDDGALLLKFWLDVPQKRLAARLAEEHDKRFARFEELDWALATDKEAQRRAHEALKRTGTPRAPWHIVESRHRRFRDAVVLERLADALEERLDAAETAGAPSPAQDVAVSDAQAAPILASVELGPREDPADYDDQLQSLQERLHDLTRHALLEGLSSVLVFEGWDAAGKGGAIRRVTAALDPLCYGVTQIGAPGPEEKRRHYLWRFWTRLARPGRMSVFDRSWYGRVLVERVEGFADEPAWRRAFDEIVEFEAQLVESGRIVQKFWLHIDPETQLERFRAREKDPLKRYKITEDDYRNRDKWPLYAEAAEDMLARTHRPEAPWLVVPAVSKERARLTVLETLVARYEAAFEGG